MALDLSRLIEQLQAINQQTSKNAVDIIGRDGVKELRRNLAGLSLELEESGEIVDRILYSPTDIVTMRIAVDLHIFELLKESPKTLEQLAAATKTEVPFLGRIVRQLTSNGAIVEQGEDAYVLGKVGRAFTTAKGVAAVESFFDCIIPAWMSLPAELAETSYVNPSDPEHTAFQRGLNTDKPFFPWVAQNPKLLANLTTFIGLQQEGHACWLDFYPLKEKMLEVTKGSMPDEKGSTLFVDVGGGVGTEIRSLRKRYPMLEGRMVLQELDHTIQQVPKDAPFEAVVHDFLKPQPVKGALNYYLRYVLHDWPDHIGHIILSQLRDAMVPGVSRILINEMVVPVRGEKGSFAAHGDINMMSLIAGVERTEPEWRNMIDKAGLEIEKIWTADVGSESLIEVRLKSEGEK